MRSTLAPAVTASASQPDCAPSLGPRVRAGDRLVDAHGDAWMPLFTTGRWGWLARLARPLRGADVGYVFVRYAALC